MIRYICRRLAQAIPILIGVNIITFALFFMVNSPDDMARMHLGDKHITQAAIVQWKAQHGYDKPLFYNASQTGAARITHTLFFTKSLELFSFQFGQSDQGRQISTDLHQRMWPSLALAIPVLVIGLVVNISFALLLALFRARLFDYFGVTLCVVMMSISGLFYIIVGQHVFGKLLRLVPVSGYQGGIDAVSFLVLPTVVAVLAGIGAGTRWYRTIFLEELHRDYARTAYAKGLSDGKVLFGHVLKNGMIPILTGVVVIIPSLFLGSLILESFFGIPGLGSYTIDAIQQQDFDIVRVMVFIGTLLYIIGLLLTDMTYTLVDPRLRLGDGA